MYSKNASSALGTTALGVVSYKLMIVNMVYLYGVYGTIVGRGLRLSCMKSGLSVKHGAG